MSGTTDFVGVRVFSDLTSTIAKIDTRDSTTIGMALPAPAAANTRYPIGELSRIPLDDPEAVAELGEGLARDAVNQIASEGIVTDILFYRAQHSTNENPAEKLEEEINAIAGSAGAKTGVWAFVDAYSEFKKYPGIIIAPGYTSQRLDNAANAVASAMNGVCTRLIDCMAIVDTPTTNRETAAAFAEDFATALNVIAMYPNAVVNVGDGNVTRPLSPHVAGAIVRRDKEAGNPFKAAWNRPLNGVLGPSQRVGYTDGDISSDANFLNQNGVGTVIEGRLLWAPFTTATDPTVKNWRSIKRIRTRRAIEKAVLRPLRKYMAEDLNPHTATLIFRSLDEYLGDLVALGALIDYEVLWDPAMNPATLLEAGAMRVRARFAETPDLVDLQIYTEPQPEAFDALAAAIAAAINSLGRPNLRVAA
ncbi:MAG: phage tail sheath subtilisin-like domain-containing protein [Rhizobiaceae bacterium]|nr:phage tail sheath subtilisin-like domain-containing protein [Rhizobiaceae bacterium]